MPFRCDRGTLSNARRTPQGGLRIPARVTRTGVFVYRRADGSEQRELRLPAEVFHADSLATLAGAPVTDLHPSAAVTPETWRQVSVGHVGESVKADGQFVVADLSIQDKAAMAAVETGQRKELSCGYECDIDLTPGKTDAGESYDAIQRNIRYNHVAIGPIGWGRAGKDVALRLDSGDALQVTETETAGNPPEHERLTTMKIKIDGIDYEAGSPEFCQAYDRYVGRVTADLAAQTKRADTAEGRLDSVTKDLEATKAKLVEAIDPKRIDARVNERAALATKAVAVLGVEYKADGKADRDIMIDAIRHDAKDFDGAGKSDDYIRGRFDMLSAEPRNDGADVDSLGAALQGGGRKDSDRDDAQDIDPDKARAKMIVEHRAAASKPMAYSRDKN